MWQWKQVIYVHLYDAKVGGTVGSGVFCACRGYKMRTLLLESRLWSVPSWRAVFEYIVVVAVSWWMSEFVESCNIWGFHSGNYYYGMLCQKALVRSEVSEEHIASIIRVKRISELGTSAVTSYWSMLWRNTILFLLYFLFYAIVFLHSMFWLLVPANIVPSLLILVTMMMKVTHSSKMSVLTGATWRNIEEESILYCQELFCWGTETAWELRERGMFATGSHYWRTTASWEDFSLCSRNLQSV
jgi:hypothetical protein